MGIVCARCTKPVGTGSNLFVAHMSAQIPICSSCRDELSSVVFGLQKRTEVLDKLSPAYWRPAWDPYYMGMARAASARGSCPRRQVGAVLVLDDTIIGTGYNGALSGLPECTLVGCDLMPSGSAGGVSCVRTIHAEANAVLHAARHGVRTKGATLYTTASPCWPCFKIIAGAGVVQVFYADDYFDERFREAADEIGIKHSRVV